MSFSLKRAYAVCANLLKMKLRVDEEKEAIKIYEQSGRGAMMLFTETCGEDKAV